MDYQKLNQLRTKYRNFIIGLIAVVVIGFGAVFAGSALGGAIQKISIILALVAGVTVIVLSIFAWRHRKKFQLAYKQYFVWRALADAFTNLQYNPEAGFAAETVAATNMIKMGDRYHSNDLVSGQYKGVDFKQSDIHIEERYETTDSEGHIQINYQTLFKGRWMTFAFPKKFDFDLQIIQKGFRDKAFHLFGGSGERKFVKMELESSEFNHDFDLYAQDGFEVFYLLTPDVVEKIQALGKQCGGKIMLGFVDNQLHVAIDNKKDAFEPSNCFKRIDEQKELTKINQDIHLITMLVDALLAPKTPPQTNT